MVNRVTLNETEKKSQASIDQASQPLKNMAPWRGVSIMAGEREKKDACQQACIDEIRTYSPSLIGLRGAPARAILLSSAVGILKSPLVKSFMAGGGGEEGGRDVKERWRGLMGKKKNRNPEGRAHFIPRLLRA